MQLATQLPFDVVRFLLYLRPIIVISTSVPDNNRRMVKLEASIVLLPNASLHNTELAAKAIIARMVNTRVFATVCESKLFNEN